jgi:hypothetical protein
MSERCAVCDEPLSSHPDRRAVDELGRPVHPRCSALSPEEQLLWEIFGVPQRGGPRKAAEMAGHEVTQTRTDDGRYRWQCSCGMGATLTAAATRRADVKRHQAMAIYD